jgi:hypothetical protein
MSVNTHASDVNELALLGGLIGPLPGAYQTFYNNKRERLTPVELLHQLGRANVMAQCVKDYIQQPVMRGFWTSRPFELSTVVANPTPGHPADLLIELANTCLLGLSVKSSRRYSTLTFKNPGYRPIADELGLRYDPRETLRRVREDHHFPSTADAQKAFIRANTVLQSITRAVGDTILRSIRDDVLLCLSVMDPAECRAHLETFWLHSSNVHPRYLKVIGWGCEPYSACMEDPADSPMLQRLRSSPLQFVPVGAHGVGVMAEGVPLFKLRAKFESEKCASHLKFCGETWRVNTTVHGGSA